jgi:transcriptional regulator with GAF, ATPase, and Fis domain
MAQHEGEGGAERSRELLAALARALRVLGSARDETTALSESFEHAARAFAAEKALLLRLRPDEPPEFEAVRAQGLAFEQVQALVTGRQVEGVSPTQIRRAIESREAQLVENSQFEGQGAADTASLRGRPHSVLCAPVLDPWTRAVLAVLYFQTLPGPRGYSAADLPFLDAYATALGHAFGLFLDSERRYRDLEAEWRRLQGGGPVATPEIIGDSEAMARLRAELLETWIPATAASPPRPLLVLGETGTGKDLVARHLHYYSPTRKDAPFIEYNCAGLSGELAQSTLFGHTRGAFTGATDAAPGLFRAAHRGTLFLDEIGELPKSGQELLLKVLDQWKVQPVGEARSHSVDVQLVCATNRDLGQDVRDGRFRHDLYQRLKALSLRLPSLRERPGDVRPLLTHFLAAAERSLKKRTRGLAAEALHALLAYAWPGNVRELAGVCAALVTHCRPGDEIGLDALRRHAPDVLGQASAAGARLADDLIAGSFREARARFEREFLLHRLELQRWNVPEAARSLGLSAATLYRYLQRHGLRPDDDGR